MKYEYLSVVQGSYGQGWEDVDAHVGPTRGKDARAARRLYDENEPTYPHRVINRRVVKEKVGS